MSDQIENLCQQHRKQTDEATIAEGSALEAIRNGQFDRARAAVDAAEECWKRRLELRDQIAQLIEAQ